LYTSDRPGAIGRDPAMTSSTYEAGSSNASARSSVELLISRNRRRTSSPSLTGEVVSRDDRTVGVLLIERVEGPEDETEPQSNIFHPAAGLPCGYLILTGPIVVEMTRAELQSLFDEIAAILETESSPVEKLGQIEKVMFEPKDVGDENDPDFEIDDE
jgi:hypothetical protein